MSSQNPPYRRPAVLAAVLPLAAALALSVGCATKTADDTGGEATAAARAGDEAVRDQIRIVGSSTVYPFATKVAEQFGRSSDFPTPVIESTGSGGGFKLFCAGASDDTPDITNASRAIKDSEVETCHGNGVEQITQVEIGYDGIVVANDRQAPRFALTRKHLFLALAKQVPQGDAEGKLVANPYQRWSDIDPALPKVKIEVLGPPPTSGTRDAFTELVMEEGCKSWGWIKAVKDSDEDRFKQICDTLREDGAYVEAGENDNLIVHKLETNRDALGIFGYSFLEENQDKIQGSTIDGIEPTFDNISGQSYPVSRPLFFYVKKAHVGRVAGIEAYVREFTSARAMGPDGYLAEVGLIPLPADELSRMQQVAADLPNNVGAEASAAR